MATAQEWEGRVGAEWARQVIPLDRFLGPIGAPALAALRPLGGKRVLDIGCGAGATTRALADQGAQVTGLDISPDLLLLARARFPDLRFEGTDAARFAPEAPVDALFSRCGVMFFDDPPQALAHLRAICAPGARLAFVAWQARGQNPWASLPEALVNDVLGPNPTPPGPGPGPFAWADDGEVTALLRSAGWAEVAATAHQHRLAFDLGEGPAEARAAAFFARIGTVARRWRDQDEATRARLNDAVQEGLKAHVDGDTVFLPGATWLYTARAPS